jgi:transcriptional regulator with XRE-family HTH domain
MRLLKLTKELESVISKENFIQKLQENPGLVFPIRLSLGFSQREFVRRTKISQVTLIKYEKGKSKFMDRKKAEKVRNLFFSEKPEINYDKIVDNYKKFRDMQKGKVMTPERARALQEIWQKKTTSKQRSKWGLKGARITNQKSRYTQQEKFIIDLLDKKNVDYKTHFDIATNKLRLNVDFVIFKNKKPWAIIEVTERSSNLYEYSLSYCYKSRLLREKYPNIKLIFVGSNNISESSMNLLKNEFDYVLKMSEASKILRLAQ